MSEDVFGDTVELDVELTVRKINSDGRFVIESNHDVGRSLVGASIDGSAEEMLLIADAIENRSSERFVRCAVVAGEDSALLWSPKYSLRMARVPIARADDLAKKIRAKIAPVVAKVDEDAYRIHKVGYRYPSGHMTRCGVAYAGTDRTCALMPGHSGRHRTGDTEFGTDAAEATTAKAATVASYAEMAAVLQALCLAQGALHPDIGTPLAGAETYDAAMARYRRVRRAMGVAADLLADAVLGKEVG